MVGLCFIVVLKEISTHIGPTMQHNHLSIVQDIFALTPTKFIVRCFNVMCHNLAGGLLVALDELTLTLVLEQ